MPTPAHTRRDVPSLSDEPQEVLLEEDPELLAGYRRGDREAMAIVFRAYLPMVMRALRGGARVQGHGRLRADLDALELEALAQETFLRAFSKRAREAYDGVRPFSAYLATIAKNLLVDCARKRSREARRRILQENAAAADGSGVQAAAQLVEVESREIAAHLAAFKLALDDSDRRVFEARFEQQLSLREAAAATGLSMFLLRRRDVRLRLDLLTHLRTAGYLEHADVKIGAAILDRRKERS